MLLVMGILLIAGQCMSAPADARYNVKKDTRR
jgi:hypothetical protein